MCARRSAALQSWRARDTAARAAPAATSTTRAAAARLSASSPCRSACASSTAACARTPRRAHVSRCRRATVAPPLPPRLTRAQG